MYTVHQHDTGKVSCDKLSSFSADAFKMRISVNGIYLYTYTVCER